MFLLFSQTFKLKSLYFTEHLFAFLKVQNYPQHSTAIFTSCRRFKLFPFSCCLFCVSLPRPSYSHEWILVRCFLRPKCIVKPNLQGILTYNTHSPIMGPGAKNQWVCLGRYGKFQLENHNGCRQHLLASKHIANKHRPFRPGRSHISLWASAAEYVRMSHYCWTLL